MHLWLRLGIVQASLASALALHKRWFFVAHELFLFAHEFHEFTRITKRLDNGDLIGRTNFH